MVVRVPEVPEGTKGLKIEDLKIRFDFCGSELG